MQPRHARARLFLLRALPFVPRPAVRGSHSAHDSVPHSQPSLAPPDGVAMLEPSGWRRRSVAGIRSRPEKTVFLMLPPKIRRWTDQWGRMSLGTAWRRPDYAYEPAL